MMEVTFISKVGGNDDEIASDAMASPISCVGLARDRGGPGCVGPGLSARADEAWGLDIRGRADRGDGSRAVHAVQDADARHRAPGTRRPLPDTGAGHR